MEFCAPDKPHIELMQNGHGQGDNEPSAGGDAQELPSQQAVSPGHCDPCANEQSRQEKIMLKLSFKHWHAPLNLPGFSSWTLSQSISLNFINFGFPLYKPDKLPLSMIRSVKPRATACL